VRSDIDVVHPTAGNRVDLLPALCESVAIYKDFQGISDRNIF